MRVLFDGFWWHDGPPSNRSVQRELIETWAHQFPEDVLIVAVRSGVSVHDLPVGSLAVRTRLWPHGLSNVAELSLIAARVKPDVVVAHNFTPVYGTSAVFIHDAMFRDHPAWFSNTEHLYFRGMLPTARRARHVFTSSQTEADRISRLRPELKPVHAIGLAVPSGVADASGTRPSGAPAEGPFALTVGRLNLRKNLAAIIDAVGFSEAIQPSSPLMIVGSAEHSGKVEGLPPSYSSLMSEGRIRFLGRVTDDELAWLYIHASLVITLSRDEGFGLTPLEAVHFGAPLLVSDIAAHRETVSGYAKFVSPDAAPADVASAIDVTWDQPPPADQRQRILATYSWALSASRMRATFSVQ